MNRDEAKMKFTGEKPSQTLDEFADAMLERVAAFFGECVGSPDFCGFNIEEKRDAEGGLLSLTIIPTDMIAGTAARRI